MKEHLRIRTLTARPGIEQRHEFFVQTASRESIREVSSQAILGVLAWNNNDGSVTICLENPVKGGPVAVCYNGQSEELIPGEMTSYASGTLVLFLQKPDCAQIILIDREAKEDYHNLRLKPTKSVSFPQHHNSVLLFKKRVHKKLPR